jgi:FkbM family methyltransferase
MDFYRPPATCQISRLGTLYEATLGQRRDGTFVEVGAFDGDTYSNTSCLADLGWRGVYIEPVPQWAEICRTRHRNNPRVSVAQCAIGATPGRQVIEVAHSFSSLRDDVIERSKEMFRNLREDEALVPFEEVFTGETVEVEVHRLETVLAAHRITPGFEVLVVDVEGYELEVFDSFDLKAWRPTLVIAELMDRDPRHAGSGLAGLRARILQCGYAHLHVDEVNTVFERVD